MGEQTRIVTRSRDGESVIYPTGETLALDTEDIVAAWTFAGQSGATVHNDARGDFDGTRQNAPQWRWDRTAGPCIRGDGSQRRVQLSDHDNYTGAVTFCGFLNPRTNHTGMIGARQQPYLAFGVRGTQVEVAIGNQQTVTSDSGLELPAFGDWQLVGVRADGSTAEWFHLYEGDFTTNSFSYNWPTSGSYGMRLLNAEGTGHFFDGDQGLTLLYERELGDDELRGIYNMVIGD